MKKIYLLSALALGALFNANAQVVFNSSIESWSAGLPTDMFGAKSNIGAANVTQVTGSSDYGTESVRLTNATTGHKRFTTLQLSVIDTKTYEIKFWVKGNGEIRTGLFDGRATGAGYATYNPYITVNSSAWTMYTQNIVCANDTTGAEFIFSVVNTVAPDHIMLDSIIISEIVVGPPANVSIYDIQYTTVGPGYASPYATQTVNTGGIVTGYYFNGYFIQTGSGPWNGVEVYDTVNNPVAGDSITLTATVEEFFNNTRLNNVTAYTLVSAGNPVPVATYITTTQGNTEDFEGTLCTTVSMCGDDNSGFGMWTVYTSPDSLRVDDLMYSFGSQVVGTYYDIVGVITYSFGEYKLNPRKPSDVTVLTGVNETKDLNEVILYPNPANTFVKIDNVPSNTTLNLIDLTGKTILTTTGDQIQTSTLTNGVYFVKLISDENSRSIKLVVKH
jgi:Secretion system C-terminal sorting domain